MRYIFHPSVINTLFALGPLLIWLAYVWPTFGYRFRRKLGPWLVNFDQRDRTYAYIRDATYTLTFWLMLLPPWILGRDHPMTLLLIVVGAGCLILGVFFENRLEQHKRTRGVGLLLADPVSRTEVVGLLAERGVLIPGRQREAECIGRMRTDTGYVWVHDQTHDLAVFDPTFYEGSERISIQQEREQIVAVLGGEPQIMLMFTISEGPGIEQRELAAMQLMCAFAERWRCVLVNGYRRVYPGQEICRLANKRTPILGFEAAKSSALP
jgi:hypothetical protein